jgi:hypothetical protein
MATDRGVSTMWGGGRDRLPDDSGHRQKSSKRFAAQIAVVGHPVEIETQGSSEFEVFPDATRDKCGPHAWNHELCRTRSREASRPAPTRPDPESPAGPTLNNS